MTNFSGHYFGHYFLQRRIGSGGYADVYEAKDVFLDRYVAVKVLKVRVNPSDLREVIRNAREARTTARLRHPHIVGVIEFNIHRDIPYIVMEYAKNGSLRHVHRVGESLPEDTIIHYLRQITEALNFIHANGIIHQDVKPENMLLGDNNEILVSDFGTVAFIQNTGPQNVGECIGTVKYMAPERFLDDAPTPASDIYSLAVVVFEWYTGEQLFSGSTSEIIRQHRFVIPSTRRMNALGISPAIQRVLLKALAKNPLDRYHSAPEFYAALEQAMRVLPQQIVAGKRRSEWGEMAFIFIICMLVSLCLGIMFYVVGIELTNDLFICLSCLVILPILGALICRNRVAMRIALAIPVAAALIGFFLHSWLGFWWTLPFSFITCSFIGLLQDIAGK